LKNAGGKTSKQHLNGKKKREIWAENSIFLHFIFTDASKKYIF